MTEGVMIFHVSYYNIIRFNSNIYEKISNILLTNA